MFSGGLASRIPSKRRHRLTSHCGARPAYPEWIRRTEPKGRMMNERGHVIAVGGYRREPCSVAKARKAATRAYATYPWIDADVVELLVSEAVTNTVLHAEGSHFYLVCHSPSHLDGSVQVEVHDRGSTLPRRRQPAELDENGRGLALLDLLAVAWRTERTATGKSLIFILAGGACPG